MMSGHDVALKAMVERGNTQSPPVTVTEMAPAERINWIMGMPQIAQQWAKNHEAKGLPARQILDAYMDAMRKRGVKPVRDWDK
jgi:hypothetical protein